MMVPSKMFPPTPWPATAPPNPTLDTSYVIDVAAGDTVTAIWRHTLQSGPDDVMDRSHKCPTLAYLKKVDDAATASVVGDGWFKIQEAGYDNGDWATIEVIDNGGNHYMTIPDCLEDGDYLLRAEMIALHNAGGVAGAQLYVCVLILQPFKCTTLPYFIHSVCYLLPCR